VARLRGSAALPIFVAGRRGSAAGLVILDRGMGTRQFGMTFQNKLHCPHCPVRHPPRPVSVCGGHSITRVRCRMNAAFRRSVQVRPVFIQSQVEHFQLLRSAGFPACGFRRLSSRLFRENETRDKNVPQTRRQECLRYIKVGTALASLRRVDAMSLPGRDVPTNKKRAAPKSGSCEEEITKTTCLIRPFCGGTARDRDRPTRPTPASWVPEHQPPRMTSNQAH